MDWVFLGVSLVAAGLFVYLLWALIRAEEF
jgi:K+-transporting ATPase KdpF subunit